jgi:hypothetical protein
VGLAFLGNRKASSVRSMLDELEGALTNARSEAAATGRDVAVEVWGNWTAGTPLVMAYGDNSLTTGGVDNLKAAATDLLAGSALPNVAYAQTVSVPFHFRPADVTYTRARVVLVGSGDWTAAMNAAPSGQTNTAYTAVDPFKAGDPLDGAVSDANNLCGDGTGTVTKVVIGGGSQRFQTAICIQVVGTSPSAGPLPGSPMGILVVQANGATVFKFYNPGVLEGDGQWRKL